MEPGGQRRVERGERDGDDDQPDSEHRFVCGHAANIVPREPRRGRHRAGREADRRGTVANMNAIPTHVQNDGRAIDAIGFGTYPLRGDEGVTGVMSALDLGYRLVDTAVNYRNEEAVGRAVRQSSVPRDDITITTKLPGRHHGYDETLASFDESRSALDLDVSTCT